MNEMRDLRGERPLPLPSRQSDEGFHTLSSSVKVEFAARSHRGSRLTNEDHYLVLRISRHHETIASSLPEGEVPARFEESGYGMVVADGMGGTGSGEAASRLAISTLVQLALHFGKWNVRVTPKIADEIIERGLRFYRSVDEHVTEAGLTSPWLAGMGTTLTAAYIADDALFILHVGHSRAYLLRDGRLTQLTRDQTLAQRLETGTPGPIELASHDLSHLLTDAIGGRAGSPSIQVGHFRLQPGDCVLLCTNGLTDLVDNESSQAILLQPRSLDERCQALVDLALERGSEDNVTAVLANYSVPGGPVRGSVTHL
jgi:protein phosphatase